MVVYVTSEANLKNLEVNRQNTRKIADPRGLTDAQVAAADRDHQAALSHQRRPPQRARPIRPKP